MYYTNRIGGRDKADSGAFGDGDLLLRMGGLVSDFLRAPRGKAMESHGKAMKRQWLWVKPMGDHDYHDDIAVIL